MKTILVTGSNGLLGQKIIYSLLSRSDVRCISTAKGDNRMRVKDGYHYESLDITSEVEVNKIIEKWKSYGFEVNSAFRSQALLQLTNAYCTPKRCLNCSIGNKVIRRR